MNDFFEDNSVGLSDNELVALVNAGEYDYLKHIISRYMPLILKTAAKADASGLDFDDLVEEGILAVFSAVKAFDATKACFSAFVSICIKRAVNTHIRASSASKRIPDRLLTSIENVDISDPSSPEELYIERESYKNLTDSIRVSLSALEYRVLCAYLSGKSYRETADMLGLSFKSVDNALRRIRKKLKDRETDF